MMGGGKKANVPHAKAKLSCYRHMPEAVVLHDRSNPCPLCVLSGTDDALPAGTGVSKEHYAKDLIAAWDEGATTVDQVGRYNTGGEYERCRDGYLADMLTERGLGLDLMPSEPKPKSAKPITVVVKPQPVPTPEPRKITGAAVTKPGQCLNHGECGNDYNVTLTAGKYWKLCEGCYGRSEWIICDNPNPVSGHLATRFPELAGEGGLCPTCTGDLNSVCKSANKVVDSMGFVIVGTVLRLTFVAHKSARRKKWMSEPKDYKVVRAPVDHSGGLKIDVEPTGEGTRGHILSRPFTEYGGTPLELMFMAWDKHGSPVTGHPITVGKPLEAGGAVVLKAPLLTQCAGLQCSNVRPTSELKEGFCDECVEHAQSSESGITDLDDDDELMDCSDPKCSVIDHPDNMEGGYCFECVASSKVKALQHESNPKPKPTKAKKVDEGQGSVF